MMIRHSRCQCSPAPSPTKMAKSANFGEQSTFPDHCPFDADLVEREKMRPFALLALAGVLVAPCAACFRAGPGWWPEAGTDVGTYRDAASLETTAPSSDGISTPGATCVSRCCIGRDCLEFGTRLQAGLVLWVDRTSIVQAGFLLNRWRDRSPDGNDIVAVNPDSPPRIQLDEVGPMVEIDEPGVALATSANGTPFDRDDFTVLVLGRCDTRTDHGVLFRKRSNFSGSGVSLYCHATLGSTSAPTGRDRMAAELRDDEWPTAPHVGYIPSRDIYRPGILHLAGVRRVDRTRVELRVDGAVQREIPIPEALFLNANPQVNVGARGGQTEFDGGFAAGVVVRGSLTDAEVAELEAFLLRTSGKGAPPLVTSQQVR
jgi:hypothetical protein